MRDGGAASTDAVLLVALLAAFAPALVAMSATWETVDYQAHGYLVLPVAAGMAWARRDALARAGRRPSGAGLLLLLGALAAYGAGVLAGLVSLQGIALPAALAGLVLWRRGTAATAALAFPLGYLIFMVPVPPAWLAPLVTALQGFVTGVAITVLHAFDVPALREGNVLIVPEGSLFVAEACSGITSVVTLLPVAALLAFLMGASRRQTAALLLAVVPVAMVWNLARVLATVVATRAVGVVQATTGSLHETAGLLTFALGCVSLLVLSAWLGSPGERAADDPPGPGAGAAS